MFWFQAISTVIALPVAVMALALLLRQKETQMGNAELSIKIESFNVMLTSIPTIFRDEGRLLREELHNILLHHQQGVEFRLTQFAQGQSEQLSAMRSEASDGRSKLEEALKSSTDSFSKIQTSKLGETNQATKDLADRLQASSDSARDQQKQGLESVARQIQMLTETNEKKQEAIRETLTLNLDGLRKDNEAKLEQMRATVEEKLQGTLETRLGESFKQVSERLELVHKGLGEMQTLATGVGDLKRVLTNVKSRGGWAEMRLETLLNDMLTPEQFNKNVRIRPDSAEVVEFAIRMPGKSDDTPIHLPIDAKFPQEHYDRLMIAQETGAIEDIEKLGLALERAIRTEAKSISEKYVQPPYSTDFAIMYLSTEGLFAEVIRRPGLCAELQSKYRIIITGPTTISALLNSLQMGFRTLAIEKRSSEVWQVLSAAKSEFAKYGKVWQKIRDQLATTQKTVEIVSTRARAVERTLRDVETLEIGVTEEQINIANLADFDNEDAHID